MVVDRRQHHLGRESQRLRREKELNSHHPKGTISLQLTSSDEPPPQGMMVLVAWMAEVVAGRLETANSPHPNPAKTTIVGQVDGQGPCLAAVAASSF